ncbi:MAG: hypothetical protein ACR2MB_08995 [Acidimicrobiales bacterium]
MILVNRILGHRSDAFWRALCDAMERQGKMETLLLTSSQWPRARLQTQEGTVVGVDFRDLEMAPHTFRPGSVVFYEEDRRIVLARVRDARVLAIASLGNFSLEQAFALGKFCGQRGWGARVLATQNGAPQHGLEIIVPCESDEAEMEIQMRECPLRNLTWNFRDRSENDPL